MKKVRTNEEYLCGYCYEYAALLKEMDNSLLIECVTIPRMNTLIHAYCVDSKGDYFDIRGKFTDFEEFISFFDVVRHKEKREKFCEFKRFSDITSFKVFLNDFFKDGVTVIDEETEEECTVPFVF